ncbi:toprim domain-containing protein [Paenibacillus tuaregi]|uniref:toprim domain-containing protein n=1 Tax=Paenibacillus tuaregi TaxID=1816681 RepID=UPI0008384564|nr:toprim domain-containing protein [Paenibacillus tuaregi]
MDILRHIEHYPWRNPRWHPLKLEASSPFRPGDDTPSFSVNLDPSSDRYGWWNDWGAKEKRWRAGPPEKLISFILNITDEEAAELIYKGSHGDLGTYIHIRLPDPDARVCKKPLDITFEPQVSEYLLSRGISAEVQRLHRTSYDPAAKAVILPWWGVAPTPDGQRLLNVKYRSTRDKRFWYARNGAPIRDLIYGIDVVYQRSIKRAAIVEAEIDALTLCSMGIPAIATGGAAFNEKKRDLILRSPIEEIVIVRDNDEAGRRWRNDVVNALRGKVRISIALVLRGYKDVNEARGVGVSKIRTLAPEFPFLRMTV